MTKNSTGKNFFCSYVIREFDIDLPLMVNVISLLVHNAVFTMGSQNGMAAFVKKNPNIFVSGSLCPLLHLVTEKGAKEMSYSPVELLTR